jgi:hypothetical protein
MKRLATFLALIGMAGISSGCLSMNTEEPIMDRITSFEMSDLERVKPWERDVLSREDMAWQPDKVQSTRRSHIFFSKEGALGAGSAGGGGCGCN